MPPTDDSALPPRSPRRSLGRGPGAPRPDSGDEPREPGGGGREAVPGAAAAEAARESDGTREPGGTGAVSPAPAPGPGAEAAPGPAEPECGNAAGPESAAPEAAESAPGPAEATVAEPGSEDRAAESATPETAAPESAPGTDEPAVADPEPAPSAAAPALAPTPAPAVEDGRFKVRLANFEGPFDLLLQLISKHKLDVTEVALSKVTDEFMTHIRAMGPDWDLDQTTEFLVVAATLLDLKAARLLPSAEVEDEADLALLEARDLLFARLLQYRAYKQIAEIFSTRLDEEGRRYPRTVGLEPHHAELLPEVVISIGAEGFAKLAVKAMQPRPKPQVYVDHIHAPLVSVREQAEVVVAMLREAGEVTFRQLAAGAPDTLTVVARFLALLELYREKAVVLDQEDALGELTVRWAGGEGTEQPLVTDEFDQEVRQNDQEVRQNQEEEKA
ncbi:segregation/condensation protein A [Streptomyces sp. NBC_01142]|uniref:segregation and condensation protein A n=1 Tax=Streptomyces sp. NBC_01142 TaxID=2975865 RepID=UPI002257D210|nr:segregation/condensation protein A [Streptomyces sp. NBC_01142]MCX4822106.1 segregation/condensation protein A [Streptomyces sp. NBC_01142]